MVLFITPTFCHKFFFQSKKYDRELSLNLHIKTSIVTLVWMYFLPHYLAIRGNSHLWCITGITLYYIFESTRDIKNFEEN